MEEIKQSIQAFLARAMSNTKIGDDDNIFELGLVHSLFTMQMILFIEAKFGIELEPETMTPDDIASVNRIAALVASHLSVNSKEVNYASS